MPHPLDPIRQVIEEKSLELSNLAELTGSSEETLKKLLDGELDPTLCNQGLSRIERMGALNALANLAIVVNELSGSEFDSNSILKTYDETECV